MAIIRFRLNGEPTELDIDPNRRLLWVLRTELQLTGTKYGCGAGLCGSCTVIVDGAPARSCRTRMRDIEGAEVMTIEGLAGDGNLHPLQEEFAERGALQCGYCTPGMIMQAYGLLLDNSSPSRDEIIDGMNRNLCRCAAHKRIVEAIEAAAGRVGAT